MKQTYEIPFAVEETLFYPNKTGSTYFINFSGGRTCYRCHVLTPTDLQIFMCLPLMGNNLWIMCVCVLYIQQRARMFRPVALMLAYLLFSFFLLLVNSTVYEGRQFSAHVQTKDCVGIYRVVGFVEKYWVYVLRHVKHVISCIRELSGWSLIIV